jgi:hypothetical protein
LVCCVYYEKSGNPGRRPTRNTAAEMKKANKLNKEWSNEKKTAKNKSVINI